MNVINLFQETRNIGDEMLSNRSFNIQTVSQHAASMSPTWFDLATGQGMPDFRKDMKYSVSAAVYTTCKSQQIFSD